jgi:hypothetical protein
LNFLISKADGLRFGCAFNNNTSSIDDFLSPTMSAL